MLSIAKLACRGPRGCRLDHTPTGSFLTRALIKRGCGEDGSISEAPPAAVFPFSEPFTFGDRSLSAAEVVEACQPLQSPERLQRMVQVSAGRTFDVVPVIEGMLR